MKNKKPTADKLLRKLRDDLRLRAQINDTDVVPVSDGIWRQVNEFLGKTQRG